MLRTLLPCTLVAVAACGTDPQYLPGPTAVEVAADPMAATAATAIVTLPIIPESDADRTAREARATALGIELAYVRVGDLEVSIEWTLKNLSDTEAVAKVKVDGGNQFFYYYPLAFVIDPREDPTPPSLAGGIPVRVPGQGTVSGVIREDALREAAIDLEAITRGEVNPFAALLTVNEDDPTIPVAGVDVPQDAASGLVRFDITLEAPQHMILEYVVRVRDQRGLLHDQLLAAPIDEIVDFAPVEYIPPPPPA